MKENNGKKILKSFIFIFVLILHKSIAQDVEGSRVILMNQGFKNATFYLYKPAFAAKAIFKKLEEVNNQYPEELMSSILSVNTQGWENFNTLGGENEAELKDDAFFESINRMNREKNFFDLRCKLAYEANGEHFAIIKFYLFRENTEPICGAYAMQKIENRWYKTSTNLTTTLAFLLMQFNEEKLDLLFQQNGKTSPEINQVLLKIIEGKKISLPKLIAFSNTWKDSKYQNLADFFYDKNSWINKK
jgi:hypothetical protein